MSPTYEDLRQDILTFDPSRPIGDNYTPPASWYTHPRFLEIEKETVFRNHWLVVGRSDQVAEIGSYFTSSHMGRPIVVVRDEAHVLRAFYNVCSHHGTCVARGEGKTEGLVCPYHGWTYSLDGQLRKAPRAGAIQDLLKKNLGLKSLPVKHWGPLILVHFGTQEDKSLPAGLEDLQTLMAFDGLNFVKRVSYPMNCNWKVFIDNYLDGGYHVPHMHKALAANLEFNSYQTELSEFYSVQSCRARDEAGRLGNLANYAWIYPAFTLNRYGRWLDTNLVLPLDTRRCIVIFDYYYEGDPTGLLEGALADSHLVQQEDNEVCDLVQAGLESGVYERGIYAPRYETPMYHFHQLLAQDLRSALGENTNIGSEQCP